MCGATREGPLRRRHNSANALTFDLLGPAVHLVNLIPPKASLATPSIHTVHEILTRANLPSETIALAVCILDSLNAKFSQNWRQSCPLARSGDEGDAYAPFHIDAVRPELMVLASLIVAVKFLEDYQEPTRHYASSWGNGLWTCEQINVTERCIMKSLGYRIMPLWDRGLIQDALADMERAGKQAHAMGVSRKTVAGPANPLTPAETPKWGHLAWSGAGVDVSVGGAAQAGPACGLGLDHRLRSLPLAKLNGYPFPSASATPPAEDT